MGKEKYQNELGMVVFNSRKWEKLAVEQMSLETKISDIPKDLNFMIFCEIEGEDSKLSKLRALISEAKEVKKERDFLIMTLLGGTNEELEAGQSILGKIREESDMVVFFDASTLEEESIYEEMGAYINEFSQMFKDKALINLDYADLQQISKKKNFGERRLFVKEGDKEKRLALLLQKIEELDIMKKEGRDSFLYMEGELSLLEAKKVAEKVMIKLGESQNLIFSVVQTDGDSLNLSLTFSEK